MRPAHRNGTTPGIVQFYQAHQWIVVWIEQHFLLLTIAFFGMALLYAVFRSRKNVLRRRKLRATATQRNLAAKIGPRIGWKNAERFIEWPRKVNAVGAPITIRYPEHFTALDREIAFIPEVISALVGGVWDANHDHRHHRLRYVRRAEPRSLPEHVDYEDDPTTPIDMIPFAKNDKDEWIYADITDLTPHVLISATTGWGKTTTLSLFVAHLAARGAIIDICDPKMIGFAKGFEGLPMVHIATEIEDMINTVEQFRAEMEDTYRRIRNGTLDHQAPLRVLVIDELGSFADMCLDHWNQRGTPPVFRSMKRILWQGRAAGFHVICATQQANVKSLFGASDARDQYSLRIAAGPQSAEAWAMLFGSRTETARLDIEPIKGRAQIGISAEFTTGQLARITPAQARRIASRGHGRHPANDVANVVSVVKKLPEDPGEDESDPDHGATITTLRLVPSSGSSPARAEPPARGRPADREAVQMECGHCERTWETRAASGSSVKCPACGKARRVPTRARAQT